MQICQRCRAHFQVGGGMGGGGGDGGGGGGGRVDLYAVLQNQ